MLRRYRQEIAVLTKQLEELKGREVLQPKTLTNSTETANQKVCTLAWVLRLLLLTLDEYRPLSQRPNLRKGWLSKKSKRYLCDCDHVISLSASKLTSPVGTVGAEIGEFEKSHFGFVSAGSKSSVRDRKGKSPPTAEISVKCESWLCLHIGFS